MQDKVKYRRQDKEELLSGIHLQKLRQAAWQYWHSIHKAPDRAKTIEQSVPNRNCIEQGVKLGD